MEVAVRELKDRLSELLRKAEAGEEIVVTSHGRPIARILPVEQPGPAVASEALARLRAQPWLLSGDSRRISRVGEPVPAAPDGQPLLSDLMLADRE